MKLLIFVVMCMSMIWLTGCIGFVPNEEGGEEGNAGGSQNDGQGSSGDGDLTNDTRFQHNGQCSYPPGPYEFDLNSTIMNMYWENAERGSAEELGIADMANFETFFCDSDVNSIFMYVGSTDCPFCIETIAEIRSLTNVFRENGVLWIFIITDAISALEASRYFDSNDVNFGWRTNDRDNSEGAYAIVNSDIASDVPWIGVFRISDMVLVRHNREEVETEIETDTLMYNEFDIEELVYEFASK